MLTLFHSPFSRSTGVVTLLDELGALDHVELRPVTIQRQNDFTPSRRDPANPHPEGKVPYLVHNGIGIRERPAIFAYLTELFPQAGLAPMPGDPQRGAYLSWLHWYGAVLEPVLILHVAGIAHDWLTATFRGPAEMTATLRGALERGPWLLGDEYSAADLLCHSPFIWFPAAMPDDPLIRDWVARCNARPARARAMARDEALHKAQGA